MRPPGPVPVMSSTLMLCSATSRRTTGDSKRLSDGASSAGAVGSRGGRRCGWRRGPAAARRAGGGLGRRRGCLGRRGRGGAGASGCGRRAARRRRLGLGAALRQRPRRRPRRRRRSRRRPARCRPPAPRISVTVPAIGDGTSVSTLSVLTSNNGSSAATVSPTFLNQRVIVPSVTVSPSCGNVTSAMVWSSLFDRIRRSGCGR